jgi:isoquinoline 1-oxidoreductase beta subunit
MSILSGIAIRPGGSCERSPSSFVTFMNISRRTLVIGGLAAGGGLAVAITSARLDDGDAVKKFADLTPGGFGLNAWVTLTTDDRVICGVHRAEMGQGVCTALPMLIAEELDVDWRQVRYEFTPIDRDYFNFGVLLRGQPLGDTTGRPLAAVGEEVIRRAFHMIGLSMTISSTSVVDAWDSLRMAGAAARAMLIAAAAEKWSVPADRLRTDRGAVVDPTTQEQVRYGELAQAAARMLPPADPVLRRPRDFRIIGTSPARLDIPSKVNGAIRYAIDTVLPGMLFASVRHSPLVGTRIAGVDNAAEVSRMDGVAGVVTLGDRAVAVVARDTWSAMRGLARLSLKPEPLDGAVSGSAEHEARLHDLLDDSKPAVFRKDGDALAVLRREEGISAEYSLPFLAHYCMEPMNCTALLEGERLSVWAPTQAETIARDVAAAAAEVSPGNVTVHRTAIGGGFGRRAEMDFVSYAAATARAFPGRPIKLTYSRAEDIRHDMYRPAAVIRVRGVLGANGRVRAMDYVIATQSVTASYYTRTPTPRGGNARRDDATAAGASNLIYQVPDLRVAFSPMDSRIPVGFWRSVGNSHNCFAIESFMDECAAVARADPLRFRLDHLADRPAHRAVLEEVRQLSGWDRPLERPRGRGLSLIESHDSIVAQVVEVTAGNAAVPRVDRVYCVIDCRQVIHPDIVVQQMESGIIDGLTAALGGAITTRGGVIEQESFADYRALGLARSPEISVRVISPGGRPGGVGEPGVPGIAPALANAIFSATGERVRKLPLG